MRRVAYRSKPSESVLATMELVQQSTLYLINHKGPTSVILSDSNRRFNVTIGDLHSCSCKPVHSDPCVHIVIID
jgi:hypothetical protein